MRDRLMTGANVNHLKKYDITPQQEKYIAAVEKDLGMKAKRVIKDSIVPTANNVIVTCCVSISNIYKPGQGQTGEIMWSQIFKVSKKVENQQPDMIPGKYCAFNQQIINVLGQEPCFVEKPKDKDYELRYYKINAEQIDYICDYISEEEMKELEKKQHEEEKAILDKKDQENKKNEADDKK